MLKIQLPGKLYALARDRTQPVWLRVSFLLAAVAFQAAVLGLQLTHFSKLSAPGYEVYLWGSVVLTAISALVITLLGLEELKRAAEATGKQGFLRQMIYILWRTFLFVLLPCLIITALLVSWAILTHQPAFR